MNNFLRRASLFLTSFHFLIAVGQPNSISFEERYLQKQQLVEDYQLVYQSLTQYHPAPFFYTSQNEFAQFFSATVQNFPDSMTERSFIVAVMQLVAMVKCGHTFMSLPDAYLKSIKGQPYFLPFDAEISNGRLLVSSTIDSLSTIKKGDEILSINGITAEEIITAMRSLQARDGYSTTYLDELVYRRFRFYYFLIFGYQNHFDLIYKNEADHALQVRLLPTNKSLPNLPTEKIPESWQAKIQNEWGTLYVDTVQGQGILKIKSFGARKGYKKFYKNVFAYLASNPQLPLIIDLRNNPGGYFYHGNHFLTYFHTQPFNFHFRRPKQKLVKNNHTKFSTSTKLTNFAFGLKPEKIKTPGYRNYIFSFNPQKQRFTGQFSVITNGITFSQAAIVAAELAQLGATVYGVESGGAARNANALATANLTLPNTNYVINIPYYEVLTNNTVSPIGRGVLPTATKAAGLD